MVWDILRSFSSLATNNSPCNRAYEYREKLLQTERKAPRVFIIPVLLCYPFHSLYTNTLLGITGANFSDTHSPRDLLGLDEATKASPIISGPFEEQEPRAKNTTPPEFQAS